MKPCRVWSTALAYAPSLLQDSPADVQEDVSEVENHKEVFLYRVHQEAHPKTVEAKDYKWV